MRMLRLVQFVTAILILMGVIYRFIPSQSLPVGGYSKTSIALLLKQSKDYDGKTVTVNGTVAGNAGIFGYGGYRIRQGADEILIISSHGIPASGAEVTVSGVFRQAFAVNTFNYPVIVETK